MSLPRYLRLISGFKMPSIGLGTFEMHGDQLKEILDFALAMGYKHIDTASGYENEKEIGEVINDRIRAGKMKRSDVFITSKVPRTNLHERKEVFMSTQQTLDDLKLSHVDMLLIHSPWPFSVQFDEQGKEYHKYSPFNVKECWGAMESLHQDGSVSSLGVSNFTANQVKSVLNIQKVPLSNVQLEAHVYYQQNNLKKLCDDNGIVISAYAPLGAPARPSRHVYGDESVLNDPLIVKISEQYKKTSAQVLLNFLVKNGMIVLPKSSNRDRLKENFASLDWSLNDEDFKKIQGLDRGSRLFKFLYFRGHPDFYEGEEF